METFLHTLVDSARFIRKREVTATNEVETADHGSAPAPLVESQESEASEDEMKNKRKSLDLGDMLNEEDAVKSKGKKGKKESYEDEEEDKKTLLIKIIVICLLIPLAILLIQCCLRYRHRKRDPRCVCKSDVECRPTCPGYRKSPMGKVKEKEKVWKGKLDMDSHFDMEETQEDIELQDLKTKRGGKEEGTKSGKPKMTCKNISMQSTVSSAFNPRVEEAGGNSRILVVKDAATASAANSKRYSAIDTKNASIQKSRRKSKGKVPVTVARVSERVSKTIPETAMNVHEMSAQELSIMDSSIRLYKNMLFTGLENMESVTGDSRESDTGTTSVSRNPSTFLDDGLKEHNSLIKLDSASHRSIRWPSRMATYRSVVRFSTHRAASAAGRRFRGRRCRGRRAENLPLLSTEFE